MDWKKLALGALLGGSMVLGGCGDDDGPAPATDGGMVMTDGGTMMLGGMRMVERQSFVSGVPFLKDLPGISFFFSRKGTSLQNMKILILISANIVIMEEYEPEAIALPDGSVLTASK